MSVIIGLLTAGLGLWLCTSAGAFDMLAGVGLVIVGLNVAFLGAENAALARKLDDSERLIQLNSADSLRKGRGQ